jgi:hypothetical protein
MSTPREQLLACTGFQWDESNIEKNRINDNVRWTECEEVFFNEPLMVESDEKHSDAEPRFYVLGRTDEARLLFVSLTIRDKLIRIISARDMSRRERKVYEHVQTETE